MYLHKLVWHTALTRMTHYQHDWGLHLKSERVPRLCIASIPMRVDMLKLYTHHINVYRKARKLYMKKGGDPQTPTNPRKESSSKAATETAS